MPLQIGDHWCRRFIDYSDSTQPDLGATTSFKLERVLFSQDLDSPTDISVKIGSVHGLAVQLIGYPVHEAAGIAISTVISFLRDRAISLKEVTFVLFDSMTCEAYRTTFEKAAEKQ